MQAVDITNAVFEGTGTVLAWLNVFRLMRDKSVRGTNWWATGFWATWGVWNVVFYALTGLYVSLVATAGLSLAYMVWVVLAYRYARS